MYSNRTLLFLLLILTYGLNAPSIFCQSISYNLKSSPIRFGVSKLEQAIKANGNNLIHHAFESGREIKQVVNIV